MIMATAPVPAPPPDKMIFDPAESIFVLLAREIAMDIYPLDQILKNHEIPAARWEQIRLNARFQGLLLKQVEEWNSALNTGERVKLKSLACVEEALPEFYARMHDPKENLPAKVKALEVIGGLAGLGKGGQAVQGGGGERFSVTINMGADQQIKIEAPTIDARLDQ